MEMQSPQRRGGAEEMQKKKLDSLYIFLFSPPQLNAFYIKGGRRSKCNDTLVNIDFVKDYSKDRGSVNVWSSVPT